MHPSHNAHSPSGHRPPDQLVECPPLLPAHNDHSMGNSPGGNYGQPDPGLMGGPGYNAPKPQPQPNPRLKGQSQPQPSSYQTNTGGYVVTQRPNIGGLVGQGYTQSGGNYQTAGGYGQPPLAGYGQPAGGYSQYGGGFSQPPLQDAGHYGSPPTPGFGKPIGGKPPTQQEQPLYGNFDPSYGGGGYTPIPGAGTMPPQQQQYGIPPAPFDAVADLQPDHVRW